MVGKRNFKSSPMIHPVNISAGTKKSLYYLLSSDRLFLFQKLPQMKSTLPLADFNGGPWVSVTMYVVLTERIAQNCCLFPSKQQNYPNGGFDRNPHQYGLILSFT